MTGIEEVLKILEDDNNEELEASDENIRVEVNDNEDTIENIDQNEKN